MSTSAKSNGSNKTLVTTSDLTGAGTVVKTMTQNYIKISIIKYANNDVIIKVANTDSSKNWNKQIYEIFKPDIGKFDGTIGPLFQFVGNTMVGHGRLDCREDGSIVVIYGAYGNYYSLLGAVRSHIIG